jgi:hypothetical protein
VIVSWKRTVTGTHEAPRSLQKGGSLCLALGHQVCDIVTKQNFCIHQGKGEESLLAKQSKERLVPNPDIGVDTSDNRCNESALTPGYLW